MPPSVYTIVVNWNRWAKTLECVEALSRVDYPSLRVVVVDNGSDDPPPTELEREGVEIIASPVNLGYAGGCNLGIRHGLDRSADYLLVLNNDARMDVGALTALVECADGSRENAVLSPRVVDPRGLEEPGTVRRVSPDASRLRRLVTGDPDHAPCAGCDEGHVHDVFQVRGPCLLFRADALRVAGLFDETYFHYFEEVDLVERIRRAGWRIGFCCGSTITHDKGGTLDATTPQALYYLYRNELLFRRKVYGWAPLRTVARQPVRWLVTALHPRHLLSGELRPTAAFVLAVGDAVRGRSGRRGPGTAVCVRVSHDRGVFS